MSLEGGEFECTKHRLVTADPKEWDEHCYKYKNEHRLQVLQICPNCGTENKQEIPYPKNYVVKAHSPLGSGIVLECSKCFKGVEE